MARVTWTITPRDVKAGDDGPIVIRNTEGTPGDQVICIVPGNLVCNRCDGRLASVLDEDDVAAARLILAAPRMRQILEVLRLWHARMGDWRPAIWEEAEALLDELAGECGAQHGAEP